MSTRSRATRSHADAVGTLGGEGSVGALGGVGSEGGGEGEEALLFRDGRVF